MINFSNLNLKIYDGINTFSITENDEVKVFNYLSIQHKNDLIHYVTQNSYEDGIYNPLLVQLYFELGIVFMYTNIEFTEEERTIGVVETYDKLKSNGIITAVLSAIPQDELNNLEHNLTTYIEMHQAYEKTFAGVLNGYLEMLPKNIEAVKEIMSKFNPEDFKAVIDFAKAANGDRSIN